jgi:hypothetical protein
MSPQEELANYMTTGMKDYPEGLKIFKNLGVEPESNTFLTTKTPGKIHINMLRNKLLHFARVYDIKARVAPPRLSPKGEGGRNAKIKVTDFKNELLPKLKPEREAVEGRSVSKAERVIVDANPVVRFEELPVLYQDKFRTAGELSNQNKSLHASLKLLIDDDSKKEKRAELSGQIIDNKKVIRQCYDEIDEWWKENKDKTVEQRLVDQAGKDAIDKQKRIKANKTYIQRNYGTGKKPEELQNRMDELTAWGIDYTEDIEKANQH